MRQKFIDNLIKNKKLQTEKERVDELTRIKNELANIQLEKGEDGHTPTKEELTALIKPLIPKVKDGEDGEDYILTQKDKREIASQIKVPIVEKEIKIIEKTEIIKEQPIITNEIKEVAFSDNGEMIVYKINELPIELEYQIEKEHIKGLEEYDEISKLAKQPKGSDFGTTVTLEGMIYVNGVKKNDKQLNLIAGTGVTLTYNSVRGVGELTISNDSVEGTVLTATGTINDSNLDFTFTSLPSIIVINGASYLQTGGAITWSWTTLTATLSSPVGVGGSIYGIR